MKSFNQHQSLANKANLIKYLNPSSLIQAKAQRTRSQLSNIHCRSMQDLELNPHVQSQLSKQNIKSNMHHSSLYNEKQNTNKNQQIENKSRSLSKFITFFQNSNLMGQVKKQVNQNKKKNYNGFCYDLKVAGNSTAGNNHKKNMKKKDKENINSQTLANQREHNYSSQTRSPLLSKPQTNNLSDEIEQIFKLRESLQNYKEREAIYNEKISQLQQREQHLCDCIQKLQQQKLSTDKRLSQYEAKIKQLEAKNKETLEKHRLRQQKGGKRESREQSMVIKSLKKVINQQLTKIIELQRIKIENQYLREKLGQNNESFLQSSFSNQQEDYSFQYEHRMENMKGQSMSSTVRSSVDCEFGREMFRKTKPLKNEINNKTTDNQNHQQSSSRHFKSFFQVEQSPISSSDGNIMSLFRPYESRKKNGQLKNESIKQQNNMIKISQPESSFTREAIEQVNQQNCDHELSEHRGSPTNRSNDFQPEQQDFELRQENDSILEEVDEYLTKWRNHQ